MILAIDGQVHFSWIMLGREPSSAAELLMVYADIMAHGTSLTAIECARINPQLSATTIRQAIRWTRDERRLIPIPNRSEVSGLLSTPFRQRVN